jgi:Fe2+ transport system protein B
VPVLSGLRVARATGMDALRAMLGSDTAVGIARGESANAVDIVVDERSDRALAEEASALAHEFGGDAEVLIRSQTRLDGFFLHSIFGGVVFFAIMYLLFQSIFTWAAPAMDAVETLLGALAARGGAAAAGGVLLRTSPPTRCSAGSVPSWSSCRRSSC